MEQNPSSYGAAQGKQGGEFVWDGFELKDRLDPHAGRETFLPTHEPSKILAGFTSVIAFHSSSLMNISKNWGLS